MKLNNALFTAAVCMLPSWGFCTTFVASSSDLNANDTLTWGQLGPTGTTIPNPVVTTTTGGRTVTVSQALGHGVASTATAGYGPMYAPGERLYYTDTGSGFNGAPLTFIFSEDINGFGLVCDPDFYSAGFNGTISAYDASGTLLGSFPFSVSQSAQYKQVFAGVANSVANIHRVVIDGTFAAQNPEDFSVGTALISIDTIFADGFE